MSGVRVDGLTVAYPSGDYVVRPLDGFSMTAEDGELALLLGPSGCGKTTLLSCLAGILSPTEGSIRIGGRDVSGLAGAELTDYRRGTVGVVFQAFNLVPSLTALENVAAPLWAAGVRRAAARRRAADLLERVGLTERMTHRPRQLSGGQQQRVAIARALAADPPVLLADEPTAHLDYLQVEGVLSLLRDLARPGRVVIVATHDDRMVPLADRVIDLAATEPEAALARRVELSPGEVLFEEGSRGRLVYVVEAGEIELFLSRGDGSEERLGISRAGEYFGELAPLLGFPRTATARALRKSVVVAYDVQEFRLLLGTDGLRQVLRGRRPGRARPRATAASRSS
ncbi:MAG: putative transport system ATP-binding protein [Actinomycetota bacterium]|jgi:putative ABC transport system ATP-binding protein|nr:putative transport system ATP-binding protein [Actinomycetota bacterium]